MERIERLRRVAGDRGAPPEERVSAIAELAQGVGPDVSDRSDLWGAGGLCKVLFDESDDDAVRVAVAHAAAALGVVVVNNLCRSISPDKPEIRKAIVTSLHHIGQRPMPEYFEGRLRDDLAKLDNGLTVLPFVNLTLTYGADQRIIPLLHRGAQDPEAAIRGSAMLQLAQIGDLAPATRALASEPEPEVRAKAVDAIGYYWTGETEPIAALRAATGDDDATVAKRAKSALRRLHLARIPTPSSRRQSKKTGVAEIDPRFPWSKFLQDWSLELCKKEGFALTQDDAVIESGWTGTDPVGDDELRDLEERIGQTLPPSYRSFLKTTNGYVGGGSVSRIRPAREVTRFVDEEPEWVDVWLETAGDGPPLTIAEHIESRGRDVIEARWQLLSDAIQISDTYDGAVYLLCPTIVDQEGEWEAWLFATWLPGAARFSSWWDLLNNEHDK
jgi:hypothetical protein